MAGKKREDVREEDVTGLKYFDKLAPLLARLHDVGCQRDKAGNRRLHFDQYCMLVLLFLFNPVVRSLRAIEQASELRKVQRKLGCRRASLGSLSEATDVFQPERLKEIIAELGGQLQPIARDPRGIEIQTYCAIIACMLISLWTGRKPTLRTYEMICHYFTGLAEEDELLAHLAKLQKQDA